MVCLYNFDNFGFPFTIHALACFLVFLLGFGPFAMYYASVFLLFELSTPFLNLIWYSDKVGCQSLSHSARNVQFGMKGTMLQWCCGVCLILTFFSSRIVWGYYQSYMIHMDMYVHFAEVPLLHLLVYSIANMSLNVLNAFWFYRILQTVFQRLFEPKSSIE